MPWISQMAACALTTWLTLAPSPLPPAFPRPLPAVLAGCKISNSVLGKGAYVGRGSRVESSLLLGNGVWMSDSDRREVLERGEPVYGVGEWDTGSVRSEVGSWRGRGSGLAGLPGCPA